MPLNIVIPNHDPIIRQLECRAIARGITEKKKLRRHMLPKLARSLLSERLFQLQENGDPLAVEAQQ